MTHHQKFALAALTILLAAGAVFFMTPETFDFSKPSLKKEETENLQCIARSTIIARGQSWVDKHVPYSQSKTYDGYRTDCSGFVSMAWQLSKPGLTTSTMRSVAGNIGKDQLQPGDAINCDSKHIVLFAGWTNSSKTHYIAMEEANSATGTVKRVTPYPYWGGDSCYHPIRYNSVC